MTVPNRSNTLANSLNTRTFLSFLLFFFIFVYFLVAAITADYARDVCTTVRYHAEIAAISDSERELYHIRGSFIVVMIIIVIIEACPPLRVDILEIE